jgi:hypothetical protein
MLNGIHVTEAWHLLSFQMEETASICGAQKEAVTESRQRVLLLNGTESLGVEMIVNVSIS